MEALSLDPSRISARVNRDVASQFAILARGLERDNHSPHDVSAFLMRCIITFFAEDIHLLPPHSFSGMLDSRTNDLDTFKLMVETLWSTMNSGGFSPILREHVLRFNGGLFESGAAIALNHYQFELLRLAAASDWNDLEPAISGTLPLDVRERHALGAHYTPRAYVERLVIPTVVELLRLSGVAFSAFDAYQSQIDGFTAALNPGASSFHSVSAHARYDLSKRWLKNDARGFALFVNADDLTNTPVWLPALGSGTANTIPVNRGRTVLFGVEVWQKQLR